MRSAAVLVSRQDRYELGTDTLTGRPRLGLSVSNRPVDHQEFYRLSDDGHAPFLADPAAARSFATDCRGRKHGARLVLPPGTDRGI